MDSIYQDATSGGRGVIGIICQKAYPIALGGSECDLTRARVDHQGGVLVDARHVSVDCIILCCRGRNDSPGVRRSTVEANAFDGCVTRYDIVVGVARRRIPGEESIVGEDLPSRTNTGT